MELRLIELMGGRVWRAKHLRDPWTKFPAAVVVSLGPILRPEKFRREVGYCGFYVDFANDLHRIIEVDGRRWHMDVVADMDREIAIKGRHPDARFLRVKAYEIINQPAIVRARVTKFVS
jgi:very-short-patch-repair endonuclease